MRFLKLEYVPLTVMILAVAQMASFADQGVSQLSYAVAGLFSFISLGSGIVIYFLLRRRDVAAARFAITTGVLFFVVLFGAGEYLFSTYFP
ncbi:MAG TPA: hypothetical protein VLX56_09705 [Nitrososphaerales archaeon]|nr:hypothetical protein [Nitrososphaerales archaeon]